MVRIAPDLGEIWNDEFGQVIIVGAFVGLAVGVLSTVMAVKHARDLNECREAQDRWQAQLAPPVAGQAGGVCRASYPACEPALTCASGYCVVPPPGFESDEQRIVRERTRDVANQLVASAREAANQGDCNLVRELVVKLRVIDLERHGKLIANPSIASCLVEPAPIPALEN